MLALALTWVGACGGVAKVPQVADAGSSSTARRDDACASAEPRVIEGCVDRQRYEDNLRKIAGVRPPGSRRWQRVQSLCDEELTALGFEVERDNYGSGVNVIGTRRGSRFPNEQVMVGAHYDHIPGCEGADDNASGVAGVLEVARVLSAAEHERTLIVACWDEEERGLLGSTAYAAQAQKRQDELVVYFNFDAIAYTDDRPGAQRIPPGFGVLFPREVEALTAQEQRADFITFVADDRAARFVEPLAATAERIGLPHTVLVIPTLVRRSHLAVDLERSDHASLWRAGYPAIMITDTAEYRSDAYHCRGRPDTLDLLDIPFAIRVVRTVGHAAALALRGASHDAPSDAPPVPP